MLHIIAFCRSCPRAGLRPARKPGLADFRDELGLTGLAQCK